MYLEAYRRAAAIVEDLADLLEQHRGLPDKVTGNRILEIVRPMRSLFLEVRADPDLLRVVATSWMRQTFNGTETLLSDVASDPSLGPLLCDDSCPYCAEGRRPQGGIDRPDMPGVPTEITGPRLVDYLRDLRGWLEVAESDLLDDATRELPRVGLRYRIEDIKQVASVVARLVRAEDLRRKWRYLIETEGPSWDTVAVGCARAFVISQARDILQAIMRPEEVVDPFLLPGDLSQPGP